MSEALRGEFVPSTVLGLVVALATFEEAADGEGNDE
jgi:hypothetical protein